MNRQHLYLTEAEEHKQDALRFAHNARHAMTAVERRFWQRHAKGAKIAAHYYETAAAREATKQEAICKS